MIGWLKSLFSNEAEAQSPSPEMPQNTASAPPPESAEHREMRENYGALIKEKLSAVREPVSLAFSDLLKSDFPEHTQSLWIEVFTDGPGFYFTIYSMDEHNGQTHEPPAFEDFQKKIEALWPLITEEEHDKYIVWEEDPKWGRQHALDQPIDTLDLPKIVVPWFKSIVSDTRAETSPKIVINFHDASVEGLEL